ncbi:MAG: histidinol-phosphate transaminase [Nitrospina sp.]|jgi:histidinol-phosphate aminotransferase|nr:histidinol-phosphate transaminase [Nitrospina sp.]MBT5632193.1 histidinol-phosphate transaminase [Nitrospina sp.]
MSQIDLMGLVRTNVKGLKAYQVENLDEGTKLHANENPYPPSQELLDKIFQRLNELELNRYPDPDCRSLKKAIADRTGTLTEQIIIGNGSDELIQYLMQVLCNEGETIAFPDPTFAMYGITAQGLGLEPVSFPLNDNWDFEAGPALKILIEQKARIVFISYPNNPTGNCFSEKEIQQIIEQFEGIVVLDEAYQDFSGKTFLKQMEKHNNLVILRSLSKIGLAGLRVGYGIFPTLLAEQVNKVRLPYNSNSVSQWVATELLNNFTPVQNQIDSILEERNRLMDELSKFPSITVYPSNSNFILFMDSKDGVFNKLKENGILLRNLSSHPRLKNCLRVTIGTKQENDQFLNQLRKVTS